MSPVPFPEALFVDIDGPVRGGRLPVENWDAVLDRIETLPLLDSWRADLTPTEHRREALHVLTTDTHERRQQNLYARHGLSRARKLASDGHLADVGVIAHAEIESWHVPDRGWVHGACAHRCLPRQVGRCEPPGDRPVLSDRTAHQLG
jgi:hypothetical protein